MTRLPSPARNKYGSRPLPLASRKRLPLPGRCWSYAADMTEAGSGVRLAELVAALSLATDLGLGQPQQHIIRQTLIAMRLPQLQAFPAAQHAAILHGSPLAWGGS